MNKGNFFKKLTHEDKFARRFWCENARVRNLRHEKRYNRRKFRRWGRKHDSRHDSRAFELFCKKRKNYGNSFERSLDRRGITAALVRMDDKTNRIDSLVGQGEDADPDDESLIDTLIDLGNYALMTATYLREKVREHE